MIATAGGQVIHAMVGRGPEPTLNQSAVEYSGGVPLNAIAVWEPTTDFLFDPGTDLWAVGNDGTFIQKPDGGDWEVVDLGTDARLFDVSAFDYAVTGWLVVVGDGFTPSEPDGGWG